MKSTRKIIIIGSAYPFRGGLAAYNERLAREYIKNGDDVVIYTFTLQYPSFLFPGKSQYSESPAPTDIKIIRIVNSINPLNWIKVGNRIKKQKPDLVIIKFWIPFMAPCFGTIARRIKKNNFTKIISIVDNIIPHEKRVGDRILASYFVQAVHGFVAMSKSVMEDIKLFNKTKPVLFCPHPLYDHFGEIIPKEKAICNLKLDTNYKYILFFGFIRDYKGLDLLLKSFAKLSIKNKSIKLIVAGEFYTDSKPYFDLIKINQLDEFVIMHNNFIPDEKVADYFCASDIVVQPYKNATQSGVTQIAYHFNKPMIVTDVGGLAEIIPDGKVGYVVKPDSEKLAEVIFKFFDLNKEKEFMEAASVEKEKYSWTNLIKTIEKI
ncbi:MAG TPA: glycosyltransferase [Bacteroidales bacterium]|nr:glycosyltransferase [Bacteroidales bacterium]HPS45773.1 glycosyltransferase [Bacteroidales bacterium]HQH18439.1 glycosyltransferase [Bacteroidales bacterium]HQI45121.1 glycosyltransferase [Bacteroidales bacterium]